MTAAARVAPDAVAGDGGAAARPRPPGRIAPERAPVLLGSSDHYGTLAAVRCLGGAGIPVTVADAKRIGPASWSRWVARRERCPPARDGAPFVEWLLAFGERHPGHVLYPTSDDHAFVLALHRDALATRFHVPFPGIDVVHSLLDKARLYAMCREVGLETPITHAPADEAEVGRIARQMRPPILLKPRTQATLAGHPRGACVEDPADARRAWRDLSSALRYGEALTRHDPASLRPMMQEFHPSASLGIYSVAGFAPESGERPVFRAAMKVLQWPRRLGNGVCFEHAAMDPDLAQKVTALVRRAGYHGVFEAEFIRAPDGWLAIDFNPRFYGEMGFEIARGLPMPLLVHLEARGAADALREALDRAAAFDVPPGAAWCHGFELQVMLAVRALHPRGAETKAWRTWLASRRGRVTDATAALSDPAPLLVDALHHLAIYARHPRRFVRHVVVDS